MLDPVQMFQVFMGFLIIVYIVLRVLIASDFGRVSIGIRENETRASLLGYDVRRHKLVVFAIGSGIAGLAGAMWATYQAFIDPNAFSMEMSAKALVWVMAGGVGTLVGPIIGVILLQWLTLKLGTMELLNSLAVLGAIMMVLVLALPKGIVPTLRKLIVDGWTLARQKKTGGKADE
jgi:branched-chain amino acid transport system permease protein